MNISFLTHDMQRNGFFFFNLKKYVKMLGSKNINGNWPKHFLNT